MVANWLIQYGSWCLAPFGLLGMYVVGRKKTWGWVLSMITQALWAKDLEDRVTALENAKPAVTTKATAAK